MKYIKIVTYCLFILFIGQNALGQIAPFTYWVQFTDKDNTPYSIDKPEEFLSPKSVARRQAQDIKTDFTDLPVNPSYIDSLKSLGLIIHNVSKWLNGAVILSTDEQLLDTLNHISFIANSVKSNASRKLTENHINKFPIYSKSDIQYGHSDNQIKMLSGEKLHNNGFTGEGMTIAILDAGFNLADSIESLNHIWKRNKVVATKDFVKDGNSLFTAHSHGTLVLSILAGIIDDYIYGAAPDADYILIRTENTSSEYLVEEYDWVCGAEYADSIGADVINSSLGYSLFDDSSQNHTWEDLDGKTAPVSRGALIAARKGMLVSCSAGNSGANVLWGGHITAPSDADSILCVGAVDSNRIIAPFSGRGPSFDNRIKPDVSAMGVATAAQKIPGYLIECNGTSCSSPLIAGLSACLWQANRSSSAQDVRQAIIKSSSLYYAPDSIYGYGIPNFFLADLILQNDIISPKDLTHLSIFPNPVTEKSFLFIDIPWLNHADYGNVEIYDLNGKLLYDFSEFMNPDINIFTLKYPNQLEKGYYIVRLSIENRFYKIPFIKL